MREQHTNSPKLTNTHPTFVQPSPGTTSQTAKLNATHNTDLATSLWYYFGHVMDQVDGNQKVHPFQVNTTVPAATREQIFDGTNDA